MDILFLIVEIIDTWKIKINLLKIQQIYSDEILKYYKCDVKYCI